MPLCVNVICLHDFSSKKDETIKQELNLRLRLYLDLEILFSDGFEVNQSL